MSVWQAAARPFILLFFAKYANLTVENFFFGGGQEFECLDIARILAFRGLSNSTHEFIKLGCYS
jgi:hypothetical protein